MSTHETRGLGHQIASAYLHSLSRLHCRTSREKKTINCTMDNPKPFHLKALNLSSVLETSPQTPQRAKQEACVVGLCSDCVLGHTFLVTWKNDNNSRIRHVRLIGPPFNGVTNYHIRRMPSPAPIASRIHSVQRMPLPANSIL